MTLSACARPSGACAEGDAAVQGLGDADAVGGVVADWPGAALFDPQATAAIATIIARKRAGRRQRMCPVSSTDPASSGPGSVLAAFLLILRGATATPHVAGPLMDATASAAVSSLVLGGIFGTLDLAPGWRALGWLLVLAVTSQTIGWLFITSALPRLPRAISSLMLLLQPVASLGLAALVLSERPTWAQRLGAVLICGGVLTVARRATTGEPAERPTSSAARAVL